MARASKKPRAPRKHRPKKDKTKMATQPSDTLLPAPRPRTSLRNAMRQQGIDEHKIAFVFNEQVDSLRKGDEPQHKKLLLDYVKECVKIMDPAARAGATADAPATILLNHQVPRPDRDQGASNGHSDTHSDETLFDIEQ